MSDTGPFKCFSSMFQNFPNILNVSPNYRIIYAYVHFWNYSSFQDIYLYAYREEWVFFIVTKNFINKCNENTRKPHTHMSELTTNTDRTAQSQWNKSSQTTVLQRHQRKEFLSEVRWMQFSHPYSIDSLEMMLFYLDVVMKKLF